MKASADSFELRRFLQPSAICSIGQETGSLADVVGDKQGRHADDLSLWNAPPRVSAGFRNYSL